MSAAADDGRGVGRAARAAVAVFAAALPVAVAAWFGLRAELNIDEGFYVEAARGVLGGRLPYRDAAYPQMPVLPFLDALALGALGAGVTSLRYARLAALAATVAIGVGILRGARARLLYATLVATAVPALQYATYGKTHGPAGLFLALACAALFSADAPRSRAALGALGATLAVGTRLSTLPAALALLAGLFALLPREGRRALVAAAALGGAALLATAALDPERFVYWNATYHAASQLRRDRVVFAREVAALAPGVVAAGAAALVLLARRVRASREALRDPGAVALLAGAAGVAAQLALPRGYGEYVVPFVPLLAVGAARAFDPAGRWGVGLAVIAAALGLAAPPLPRGHDPAEDRAVAEVLRRHVRVDEWVLTPIPALAAEAGRPVVPRSELGLFAFTLEMSPERAARLGILHARELVGLVEARAPAAFVASRAGNWNYGYSVPSLRATPPPVLLRLREALYRNYTLALRTPNYRVFVRAPARP